MKNLRDVAASAHFTVPRTYEALLPYLKADAELRSRFFSRLKFFFYAAAGLTQHHMMNCRRLPRDDRPSAALGHRLRIDGDCAVRDVDGQRRCPRRLRRVSRAWRGNEACAGGEKLEARVRGPNVTPGYWRDPAITAAAVDEEGFYRMGDALRPVDAGDPSKGFMFDGRLTEDFKLSSGTWVSVGPLRARVLLHLGPYVQDVVIAAPDRPFVAALLFPHIAACRRLCHGLSPTRQPPVVLAHPRVRETFLHMLSELAAESTGSSTRVARAILVDVPPSIDLGEVTDKGSLNQRATLRIGPRWSRSFTRPRHRIGPSPSERLGCQTLDLLPRIPGHVSRRTSSAASGAVVITASVPCDVNLVRISLEMPNHSSPVVHLPGIALRSDRSRAGFSGRATVLPAPQAWRPSSHSSRRPPRHQALTPS